MKVEDSDSDWADWSQAAVSVGVCSWGIVDKS